MDSILNKIVKKHPVGKLNKGGKGDRKKE